MRRYCFAFTKVGLGCGVVVGGAATCVVASPDAAAAAAAATAAVAYICCICGIKKGVGAWVIGDGAPTGGATGGPGGGYVPFAVGSVDGGPNKACPGAAGAAKGVPFILRRENGVWFVCRLVES